jgi:hypothetical protein
MRPAVLAALCLLVAAPAAAAGTTSTSPFRSPVGASKHAKPRLKKVAAEAAFVTDRKVARWLARYPHRGRITETTFSSRYRSWTVRIWSGAAGEIATGKVDDASGQVTEAWTGPQVAWKMARGYPGAFGGKEINSLPVWLGFALVFFVGLADLRRPLNVRNLDLLVLLSFSVSLWYFNRGDVFTSVPLAYPPLLYLLARTVWIAVRDRTTPSRPVWPVWVLAAATVFLAGFRVGLNVQDSNVIDVGYSGVVGAERIVHGQAPYGHMPIEGNLKGCGPADADGEIRDRIQANGRCESADERGDTYGPVAYEAYIPGYAFFGWDGKWDPSDLAAADFTSIAWDVIALLGLALVGLRFGGRRLAVTLAFAWAAFPFTQYVSSSNTNDAIMPALLVWGFWLASSPWARGASAALAGWTKFAALLVAPLWLGYPERRLRGQGAFVLAFLAASAAAFSILLLEPAPAHALHVFWDRTIAWQVSRASPFSIWDWRQYHAGLPDLHLLQRALEVLLVLGALAVYFVPRRKSPLQLAALTGALLAGFELVLTHWSYLYIAWFFPFVAFAVCAGTMPLRRPAPPARPREREARELVAAG